MRSLLLSLTVLWALAPALACQDTPTPPPTPADDEPTADAGPEPGIEPPTAPKPEPGTAVGSEPEAAAGQDAEQPEPAAVTGEPRAPLVLQGTNLNDARPPTAEEFFDGLVAPLALAPDMLLTPVMGALRNPEELIKASAAMAKHPPGSKPPPMPSGHLAVLAHVPELLHLMAENPEWMDLMKQAMTFKRAEVILAVQRVRRGALEVGNLKTDDVITVTDVDGRISIGLTDEAVLRVPRYHGSLVYLDPLVEGPQLLGYGPAITFPGYRTAHTGLRAIDSIATRRNLPVGGGGSGASRATGTHYPNVGARRSLMPGLLISRNHRRDRSSPARRVISLMGMHSFF